MEEFVDNRFDPETEPEKWESWQKAERRRVRMMQFRRLNVRVQNYFWPTKLQYLPIIFAGIFSLDRMFFHDQTAKGLVCSACFGCAKALGLALALVHLRQGIFYMLMKYRTWMIEVKPSMMTKLWYASVGLVSSKITNWLSGNWLLPSLPAPQPLESSVDRFVESMKLCLSEPRAAALRIMAERFKKTVGPSLHSKLMWKATFSRNWLAQWWIDYAYLATKASVHRTTMVGIGPSNRMMADWKEITGLMLYQVYHYFVHKLALRDMVPMCVKGQIPMEMALLDNIIGGCRVPTKTLTDSFINVEAWKEGFVIIHIASRYFKLHMYDSKGQILSPLTLRNLIEEIHAMCCQEPKDKDPCIYTFMERNQWADILQELRSDSHNDYVFRQIAEATVIVHILDGFDTFEDSVNSIGDFGGLSAWCDRTMNCFTTTGGFFYICCEHSHCDAVILGSIFSDIFLYSRLNYVTPEGKIDSSKFHQTSEYPKYSELHWNWPEKLAENYEAMN